MSYDGWKTDPDWGKSARELAHEDLDVSWQCEHNIHTACRVRVNGKMVAGDYHNCACECHTVDYCDDCKAAPCRCDEMYEAWLDRQIERGR